MTGQTEYYRRMTDEASDDYLDLEALEMSKFTTPPIQWISEPPQCIAPTETRTLSAFERLPLELRQQIYGHLGYPIAGKCWSSCPFKYGVEQTEERRAKALETYLYMPFSLRSLRVGFRLDEHYDTSENDLSLLRICKTTRLDALTLLFGNLPARFDEDLHPWRPVHHCSYFSYLTVVHLDHRLGVGFSYEYRDKDFLEAHPRIEYSRALVKQAKSIRFIARYCPALIKLRYEPYLPGAAHAFRYREYDWISAGRVHGSFGRPKQAAIDALVFALSELPRRCRYLEAIEIPRAVRRHRILPNGKVTRNLPYPESAVEVLMMHCDLRRIAKFYREDEVKAWAKDVLEDIAKRGPAYKLVVTPFN